MKELTIFEIESVSGASFQSAVAGAVIGATSFALSAGKWGGLSILNFGIGQALGVGLGLIIGGVGGFAYGDTHTAEQSENFFNNILKAVG